LTAPLLDLDSEFGKEVNNLGTIRPVSVPQTRVEAGAIISRVTADGSTVRLATFIGSVSRRVTRYAHPHPIVAAVAGEEAAQQYHAGSELDPLRPFGEQSPSGATIETSKTTPFGREATTSPTYP
jgi:hypothetical protein